MLGCILSVYFYGISFSFFNKGWNRILKIDTPYFKHSDDLGMENIYYDRNTSEEKARV